MKHWLTIALFGVAGISRVFGGTVPVEETPAYQTARQFMRGVNFGNYLEYLPGHPAANASYTSTDFALARAEGFDHIRVPVAWSLHCGPAPTFTIGPAFFGKVDAMVAEALKHGLGVVLDLHHFTEFVDSPAAHTGQFHAIWRQIATHFAETPPTVLFELFNEPNGNATTAVMNGVYREAIREIRLSNPARTLLLGPGDYNSAAALNQLVLPAEDQNLIATVHCYDPYYFTHQGAEWAYPDTRTTGVVFPGPPAKPLAPDPAITHFWVLDWFAQYNQAPTIRNPSSPSAFREPLQRARLWSERQGRPVYVGEFGCYEKADPQSRVAFYRAIRESMDAFGLGWSLWDWKSGFHYQINGRPNPAGMREAVFPPIDLVISPSGTITFPSAVGKTYVVERAPTMLPPIPWEPISTQRLSSPNFDFRTRDVKIGEEFYRVRWIK